MYTKCMYICMDNNVIFGTTNGLTSTRSLSTVLSRIRPVHYHRRRVRRYVVGPEQSADLKCNSLFVAATASLGGGGGDVKCLPVDQSSATVWPNGLPRPGMYNSNNNNNDNRIVIVSLLKQNDRNSSKSFVTVRHRRRAGVENSALSTAAATVAH